MNLEEAQALSQQFIALSVNMRAKLAAGAQERERVATALETGKEVKSYRLDWHLSTSKKLFEMLLEEARVFNAEHGHDRVSVQDMLDVLLSAGARLSGK